MNMVQNTISLPKWLYLRDLKTIEISQDIPLSSQVCPTDKTGLKTVCALVGNQGKNILRFGCCDKCGYLGYADRPSKSWIQDFYTYRWNETERQKITEKRLEKIVPAPVDQFLSRVNLLPDDFVLEIGSGFGSHLRSFRESGYKNVIGIENSYHRAKVAKEIFNINTISAPYESEFVQKELSCYAPFGLIFSYHVFEHIYDVDQAVRLSASLQSDGGYFVIAVPNALYEPTMMILLFLPHLHSFRMESLTRLLSKHGYEVIDNSLNTEAEIVLITQKTGRASVKADNRDYAADSLRKFNRSLGVNNGRYPRRLWWSRPLGIDIGGQIRWHSVQFLNDLKMNWLYRKIGWQYASPPPLLSCLVETPARRYTGFPIEIQFAGNIQLLYK